MMKDPYSVLGVDRSATDEQVKNAYREMARKFHPDNFSDNPAAAELANEKMKEINDAYDEIVNSRKGRKTSSGSSDWGAGNERSGSDFNDVRRLIGLGRLDDAQAILDGVPPERRNAEWYFLNGTVLYRRGWFDAAYTSLATACRMDPENTEYRFALNQVTQSRSGFSPYGRSMGGGMQECSCCDICAGLMCMDMCCGCCR